MVTAGLASWVYFLRCLRGQGGMRSEVGYVIATAVMLYAHLYGGFVAAAEFFIYLIIWLRGRAVAIKPRRWLLLVGAVAILFGPWVNVVLVEWRWVVTSGMFWLTEKGPHMIGRALAEYWGSPAASSQLPVMSATSVFAAAVAGVLALIGLCRGRRGIHAWLA